MKTSEENQRAAGLFENRAYVLFILVVVYTLNFIDRQIIGILAVPIKAELMLSDTQLGLMGGLAFALFYTGLGIPIAMLADRSSRTWIITIALVLWSAMTAVCGLAQNFWQIFLARLGVGVGEAGGVAPSYSLISDYFPPNQRARPEYFLFWHSDRRQPGYRGWRPYSKHHGLARGFFCGRRSRCTHRPDFSADDQGAGTRQI